MECGYLKNVLNSPLNLFLKEILKSHMNLVVCIIQFFIIMSFLQEYKNRNILRSMSEHIVLVIKIT